MSHEKTTPIRLALISLNFIGNRTAAPSGLSPTCLSFPESDPEGYPKRYPKREMSSAQASATAAAVASV